MTVNNELAQEIRALGQEGDELFDEEYGPDDEDYFASLYSKEEIETRARLVVQKDKELWGAIDQGFDGKELALSTDAPF